ncbi:co-chaperone GroES [Candidatus Roizmanbacteria bacterium RIFCSPLOWO2_12_FULL_40_12]|uniref:Co-chaperonin GroES n=1 Tax=Candidatus Roizmanbacteria bacterium RIFCSPLOWO2_01_FULL_40_42 TaxID=1802066 RepID=A0A1F7J3T0_9BACT|nr:MAG: co-chaperone GroES [Candidatus Roizmanbacteria bacterium RIFCSPHIGHO2_01_FULL_40_98]OGK29009.1 MAG: co-chaperone GroES [Candidatus Roizmanbacteria bacterium RIFCSPHIGHO2_02_FULL_40_53]OGK29994.1 MAG: co-chaperone GroES [Candidatus Roizmanbacteria bacterium RIFCSPHIGHO2_12_41_18]OGK37297.1 MAG: co-chaperone GroES [Candidatus Roizmanbacteria bacterium RIFCSPHIGHO2_12_FULL_40_130]OGK50239.1 MAG: co-chaperone GroES [Candidatus Roizmanbacteria bacterium RIFCSPLOWO2_01_FULL_40_42]OGK59343.1 
MAKSTSGFKNLKPLFDNILVRPLSEESTTPSGIVLPDSAKEKPQVGEVMEVGPGRQNDEGKLIPVTVKKGQKVLYKKWGGNEVKVGSEEWMIIEEKDIMAVVQ